MSHPFYPSGNPRFNHVAMSVGAHQLEDPDRADLTRFFHDVLGFDELTMMTVDRQRLIYSCVHWDQFIFLIAEDDPMRCPRMDHYGFSVGTEEELDGFWARARAFQAKDPRVDIVDKHVDDHGMLAITSIYVGYLLPMMVEIQWWDFKSDAAATPAS